MTCNRSKHFVLAASLVAAALVSSAHAAHNFPDDPSRPCLGWDLTRASFDQSTPGWQSNGYNLRLHIAQQGTEIHGLAQSWLRGASMWKSGRGQDGNFHGTLRGDTLRFVVDWNRGGARGFYVGHIDSFGVVSGFTYSVGDPGSRTAWTTEAPFRCVKRAVVGPAIPVPAPVVDPASTPLRRSSGAASALRSALGN